MEEERRLLYVAMTRAKDELRLLVPQRFYVHQQSATGDRHVYAARSRFIPDALTLLFECTARPVAARSVEEPGASCNPLAAVDIAERIRLLWR